MSEPSRPFAQPSKPQENLRPEAIENAGWVGSDAALSLLQQAGFPVAHWVLAADSGHAAAAARDLGFPVTLKAERPGLVHKSEASDVRLGLHDGIAVAAAFEDFCRRLGPGPVLVQAQAGPGLELAIGARRDPNFGPLMIAGLGGV